MLSFAGKRIFLLLTSAEALYLPCCKPSTAVQEQHCSFWPPVTYQLLCTLPLPLLQLLMYDEPTAGLDPVASTVVEDLIRSLHQPDGTAAMAAAAQQQAKGSSSNGSNGSNGSSNGNGARPVAASANGDGGGVSSYIVVTHQHSTIRRAVDRIIFLHEGRVVWEGSVEEFDTTDEPIVRQFASGSLDGPIVYL